MDLGVDGRLGLRVLGLPVATTPQLKANQFAIEPILAHEFVVVSLFDQFSVM
jgi:hypothetical protein